VREPLTTTLENARAMLEHALRARRVLFPCHNYKHSPIAKGIQQVIRSGASARCARDAGHHRNTHAKGVTEWNTHWRRTKRCPAAASPWTTAATPST
jgi:predicted dehydrogenase